MVKIAKKTKGIIIIGFLIAILVIGSMASYYFVSQQQQTGYSSGFTILSADAPLIKNADGSDLDEKWWRITALLGGSEQVFGVFNARESLAKTGGQHETKYDFTIDMEALDEVVDYSITGPDTRGQPTEPLYWYRHQTIAGNNPQTCPDYTPVYYLEEDGRIFKTYTTHCLVKQKIGLIGELNENSVSQNVRIKLSTDNPLFPGATSKTINTQAQTSVDFPLQGKTVAKMRWEGNLVTGNQIPNTDNYIPIILTDPGFGEKNWFLVSRQQYTDLTRKANELESFVDDLVPNDNDILQSDDIAEEIKQRVKTYSVTYTGLINAPVRLPYSSWSNKNREDSAKLTISAPVQFQRPLITMDIRADVVGIIQRIGKPKIASISCPTFTSGSNGYIDVGINNVGDYQGTFEIFKESCDDFNALYSTQTIALDPGEQQNVRIMIDAGSLNKDLSRTCRVVAQDRADPSRRDTESVTCRLEKERLCNEGEIVAKGNDIQRCDDGELVVIETCPDGVTYNGREWVCNSKEEEICGDAIDNDGDGAVDEGCDPCSGPLASLKPECKVIPPPPPPPDECDGFFARFKSECRDLNFLERILLPYQILFGLIASFVTWLFSFILFKREKMFKKTWTSILVAIIPGLLVGVLVYVALIVALIVAVIYWVGSLAIPALLSRR